MSVKIKVIDKASGIDVTSQRDWYLDTNGILYFETNDIDCPLCEADGYNYELTIQ